MSTILDKILYLYPDIQKVTYWYSKYDGTAWKDPYDGLNWENTEIAKPNKALLDSLDDDVVQQELENRKIIRDKHIRNEKSKNNLALLSLFNSAKINNENLTWPDFLDSLETLQNDIRT